MKYLIIMVFGILLFSCIERDSPSLKNVENAMIYENIEVLNNPSVEQQYHDIEIADHGHNNKGIYFPEYYLERLLETKSHKIAAYDFYELPNNNGNFAIVIFENEIIYTYNFHEGVTRRIIDYNDDEIIIKDLSNEGERIYIIDNFSIRNGNDIQYINVCEELDDWRSREYSYITNVMFGDTIFTNEAGDEIYRMENGNISYKKIEYTMALSTVFTSTEYDDLYSRGQENVYFRIENDMVYIYEIKIPEELLGDPFGILYGTYHLIDELRKL
jgi:hypothetical protein